MLGMVLVALLVAPVADAQRDRWDGPGRVDWGELRRPEYSASDMSALIDLVGINEDQEVIIRIFLDEYSEAYRELLDEARAEVELFEEQMRFARDPDRASRDRSALYNRIQEELQVFGARYTALGEWFVTDVQAVLSDEQIERWPAFERARRRSQMLPDGEISGEEVNLYAVADLAGLSDGTRGAVGPILEEYSIQLDYALQSREGRLDDDTSMRDIVRSLYRGEMDERDAMSFARKERNARVRVRDVNLQYADLIRAAIADPEEASRFEREFRRAAYPRIYRENHGETVFEAALELPGVDDATRDSIEAMQSNYLTRLEQINRTLERLTRLEEPNEFERDVTSILSRMRNLRGRPDDRERSDLRRAFEDREDLEAEAVSRLYTILTEEQVLQLPRRRGRGRDWD